MHRQVVLSAVLSLALLSVATAQYDPRKGPPVLIKPGQVQKLTWKPSPPHPDVVMCCNGALQLNWSPLDGGVVSSVVLNVDDTCPGQLQNQQYVEYIFQAANKGVVTLDFKQNGDYYISCSVGEHCSDQGMQFLLAVRGCPTDNPTYTPVFPINVNCQALQQQARPTAMGNGSAISGMLGANNTMGGGLAAGGSGMQGVGQNPQQARVSNGAGFRRVGAWLTLAGAAAAAAAVAL